VAFSCFPADGAALCHILGDQLQNVWKIMKSQAPKEMFIRSAKIRELSGTQRGFSVPLPQ